MAMLWLIRLRDISSTNVIRSYIEGAELISPQAKKIIDKQKNLMPKHYQNSYYKRRNSFGYGNYNYNCPINYSNNKINYHPSKLVFSGSGRGYLANLL
jgi:hypothetical protein